MVMTDDEKKLTAYHEAGHALVGMHCKASDPIHKATIIPRGELAKVVGDLTESLQSAQKMLRDSGGEIALRRLNKREYITTIKDLMGIRINGEKLPDDPSGRFDTIGQNQSLFNR